MNDKTFWNFCVFMYDFWHNLEYKSYKSVAECISSEIQNTDHILEIACGTGILTQEITKRHTDLGYIAIDYAQNMIDICYKKEFQLYLNLEMQLIYLILIIVLIRLLLLMLYIL